MRYKPRRQTTDIETIIVSEATFEVRTVTNHALPYKLSKPRVFSHGLQVQIVCCSVEQIKQTRVRSQALRTSPGGRPSGDNGIGGIPLRAAACNACAADVTA